jgi:hypothetical protein
MVAYGAVIEPVPAVSLPRGETHMAYASFRSSVAPAAMSS